ncbi:hypothetical protein A2V94_03900 [Candidatus Atribacteria bacterium RBG_16_35_8]|nr:MAG: hypothetical protein A2V94_03900 [Candidatus Atribacteria bacterium RBG_16_35_8]
MHFFYSLKKGKQKARYVKLLINRREKSLMEKDKDTLDNSAVQDELKELDNLEDSLEVEDLKKLD